MALVNKNLRELHRKEFQMMTPAPVFSAAGACIIAADSGDFDDALYLASSTVQYLYSHAEDGFFQIPSGGLTGTFGAGTCGVRHPWSIPYTANGGSTTTVTVSAASFNINGFAVGKDIEFLSAGIASGFVTTIESILNTGSGTITLKLAAPAPTAILNTHTFRLLTGRYYVMNAGTTAAGIFRVFDVGTLTWQANLAVTNLPGSWGTDGKLVLAYNHDEVFATGTATSATGTTLVNSAKSWTVNQWTNYQVTITGGTGRGQTRTIVSNTATALTLSAAWATTPDNTSVYDIEANEDWLYLLGNNAVTMYRYSISANTWTVLAPTTARAGAPGAGMGANSVGKSGDPQWANESIIQDGRYIYSVRAGGTSSIDRFDIAGGTAGAGAWLALNFVNGETFTTGSSVTLMGKWLYIRKDATHRFFKYSVTDNLIMALTSLVYPDGTAVIGNKIWIKNYDLGRIIQWLYTLSNSSNAVHRIMIF